MLVILDEYEPRSLIMSIRKIILLFCLNQSILILPVAHAEANVEKININTADVMLLENLRGIGPKKAAAIIEFRQKNGMFESITDHKKVNGIGQKTIDKNLDIIEVAFIPEEIEEEDIEPEPISEADDEKEVVSSPQEEVVDKEEVIVKESETEQVQTEN